MTHEKWSVTGFLLGKGGVLFSALLLFPICLNAHILPGQPAGFIGGMSHPLTGIDHIMVMVAVGLWASQIGGKAIWQIPAIFIGFMIFGGFLGAMGVRIPFVEQGIILSVILIGAVVAMALKPSSPASAVVAAIFAVLHGHVHGTELASLTIPEIGYAAGFTLTTAALHAFGVGLGSILQKMKKPSLVRMTGGLIMLAGILLAF